MRVNPKLVNTKHGKFWIDPRDEFIGRRLEQDGEYSEQELELLMTCLRPDKDAVVVGAHIGAFVIPMARRCRWLVAVEANPDTFDLLELNRAQNQAGNVDVYCGAADETGFDALPFLCGTANSGGSKRVPKTMRDDYVYDQPATVRVPTLRLDDLCRSMSPSLIHMDIEGSEVFALRGAQELLSRTEYLSVEFISHHLTHVAGVTVDEWLAPIRPHFNHMLLPGDLKLNRPHVYLEPADWHEMLQSIVNAGVGIENLIFWRQ
jgi:FkbM family methyltransferase